MGLWIGPTRTKGIGAYASILSALLLIILLLPAQGHAERRRLRAQADKQPEAVVQRLSFIPVELPGGSHLTLISPSTWAHLLQELADSLQAQHQRFTRLLGPIPSFDTAVELMEEGRFFALTGAPIWTNALFYRGRITIPLPLGRVISRADLARAVKHEYTHAVVNALSGGRCPGWLDEGLAQWAEGSENPALRPALDKWLRRNDPVALELLQGGFTKLDPEMVPAAYAQSLYLTRLVISSFGFSALQAYLGNLRRFGDKSQAFTHSFGINEQKFEKMAGLTLSRWEPR